MGIPGFHSILTKNLQRVSHNGSVVIDGNNFFYNIYEYYKLPYIYGCEGDNFAKCVKNYLMLFKKANIDCYFIFKGGNSDIEKYFKRHTSRKYYENLGKHSFFTPLYAKDIIKDVLDKMQFKYVSCEYESKNTCIALAQKLSCPVISFDCNFVMSNIEYIPHRIESNVKNVKLKGGELKSGIFNLENFMNNIKITLDDFTLFKVLTDNSVFPEDYFKDFFMKIRAPKNPYGRNQHLLKWLSAHDTNSVINQIIKLNVDKKLFYDSLARVKSFLTRNMDGGLPLQYLLGKVDIDELDVEWFQKGVILQHVHVSYVNLYKSKIIVASNKTPDSTQTNAILLSSEIIKYAYDLLTDFKGGKITIHFFNDLKQSIEIAFSTERPNYDCCTCVFENGWENIKSLNLFQHFISVTLEPFDFNLLESAPENARLLIIALVYFSRQKDEDTSNEILSILMSYVLLSNNTLEYTDVESESKEAAAAFQSDYISAKHSLKKYFQVLHTDKDLNFKVLHPLIEFQHCLHELNKLNTLCGKPFKPTLYSKTYNGTFVYNFLLYLKNHNGIKGANITLNESILVLEYFNRLWNIVTEFLPRIKMNSINN